MKFLLEGPGGLPGAKQARTIETDLPFTVGNNMHVTGNLTVDGVFGTGSEGAQIISVASANALVVGANGTTNPVLNIDTSATTVATGLNIAGAAAGSGVALTVLSSGTNESLTIAGKGTGSIKFLGAASPSSTAGNVALTNAAGSANAVNIFNYNSDATPGGRIDLYRGTNVNGQIFANAGTGLTLNSPGGSGGINLQTNSATVIAVNVSNVVIQQQVQINSVANNPAFTVTPNSGTTNPTFQVDTSTASAATGLLIKSAAAAGGLAVTTLSSGTDENLTIAAKGAGTIIFNPGVVAAAGGKASSGIGFGSLGVGLFTGTGAPSFSAMNGSIYVDTNATTTTTRIYVNKSGAGTAGTTWTNLTTAA